MCIIQALDEVQQLIVPCGRAQDCAAMTVAVMHHSLGKEKCRKKGEKARRDMKLCDMILIS